jgi:hypothetical protein
MAVGIIQSQYQIAFRELLDHYHFFMRAIDKIIFFNVKKICLSIVNIFL